VRGALHCGAEPALGLGHDPKPPKRPSHPPAPPPAPQQAQQVLQSAQRAGLLRAAAALHHQRGEFSAALACYLRRPGAAGLFEYADRALAESAAEPRRASAEAAASSRARFAAALQEHIAALVAADAAAAAALLARRLPEQQLPLLRALAARPELQFALLRAALALHSGELLRSGASSPAYQQQPRGAPSPGPRQQQEEQQQQQQAGAAGAQHPWDSPEVIDLYICLLCRHAPSEALPFLRSGARAYDVRAALRHAAAAGAADAEAYLHERLGDVAAALRLYLKQLGASGDALEAAVHAARGDGAAAIVTLPPQLAAAWEGGAGGGGGSGAQHLGRREAAVAIVAWLRRQLGLRAAGAPPTSAALASAFARHPAAAAAAAAHHQQQQVVAHRAQARRSSSSDGGGGREPLRPQLIQAHGPAGARRPGGLGRKHSGPTPGSAGGGRQGGGLAEGGSTAVTAEDAAALAASWQIRGDRHLQWIALLSPRARIRGASSASSGGGGGGGAAERIPPEAAAAWRALEAAVSFCCRSSREVSRLARADRGGSKEGEAGRREREAAQAAWFAVLEAYVERLRRLKQQRDGAAAAVPPGRGDAGGLDPQRQQQQLGGWSADAELHYALQGLEAALSGAARPGAPPAVDGDRGPQAAATGEEGVLAAALAAARAALQRRALRDVYAACVDEAVAAMADHVPLPDIVARILARHGQECFGEFRPTLLGLFSAYAFEQAIMGAANNLVTKDAFAAAVRARAARAAALRAGLPADGVGEDGVGSAAAGPPVAALQGGDAGAAGAVAPTSVVQTAHQLGVLGRSWSPGAGAASGGAGARQTAGPTEQDLLVGMLLGGAAGLGLQLRPPAARDGALSSSAGGAGALFPNAAAAGGGGGRRGAFVGGCDLAAELAALQEAHGEGLLGAPQRAQHAGAAAIGVQSGGVGAAQSSFDIDEILAWSQANA
jgi:hypothetical protein